MLTLLLVFTLLFSPAVAPQTSSKSAKPNFSGTWNARILASPDASVIGLKISYNDPKLEISRVLTQRTPTIVLGQSFGTTSSRNLVYYTDGRGEIQKSLSPSGFGDSPKSTTQRIGDKFVTTTSTTAKRSGRKITTEQTVTLEISSDGKTLTETTTFVGEGNTRRTVHVFDRVGNTNSRDINGEWIQKISNQLISLIIEHHDPELKITRRVVSIAQDETEVLIYYTDGRGETNIEDGGPMKSVTKWKDQRLVFSLSSTSHFGGDTFEFSQSRKWEISQNGESLIEVTHSKMSASAGFIPSREPQTLIYARSSQPLP